MTCDVNVPWPCLSMFLMGNVSDKRSASCYIEIFSMEDTPEH